MQDLLKSLFTPPQQKAAFPTNGNILNPIYKLSDFKRIKMGEKEFKKITKAKTMELGKGVQATDPALEALHLMDPTFLRGLTSNQFRRMLADTEINHNLAYKLQIYNYQDDQEQRQQEIMNKMKKGLRNLFDVDINIDVPDNDAKGKAMNKVNLVKKNRKGEIISECP